MRTISLTQYATALVDDIDYNDLVLYSWHLDSKGYARRNLNDTTDRGTIRMHQQILGQIVGRQIDHINGNRLDNRRENLRSVTPTEQARNVGMKKNNSSGFKGVSWHTKNGKWRAYITFESKPITIGYFHSALMAAKAYDERAIELFGQFAKTNKQLGLIT